MTWVALALVLAAAFGHAGWNFLAKRAGRGTSFVWLFSALGAALYAPVTAAWLALRRPEPSGTWLVFMAGSAVLHLVYFVCLQRGYRIGDLSIVYPLARSTGPTLAVTAAVLFFHERPSPLAMAGAGLVLAGALAVAWGGARCSLRVRKSVLSGVLVGTVIALYTLWDKQAVSVAAVPPLALEWGTNFGRALLLAPYTLRHQDEVRDDWRTSRREAVAIAILAPLSYILVLTAMAFTPVSYVAPAREVSILIGTFLGSRWLGEGDAARRLVAAGVMLAGLAALALG